MTAVLLTKPRPWVVALISIALILFILLLIASILIGLIWLLLLGGVAL